MTIEALININPTPVPTALPGGFLDEAIATMVSTNRNAVAIIQKDTHLCGILTDHDIIRAVHKTQNKGQSIEHMRVSDWMTPDVITCDISTKLSDALKLMGRHKIRHLVAVKDRKTVGIISIRDILSKMHEDDALEAKVLRDMAIASRISSAA